MGGDQVVNVEGRRLRLSHLDKVLYPATGTTKGEVIDYLSRIAPVLLPHVAGRPVTRKRWPDGAGTDAEPGASFFAKQLEPGAPSWVPRRPIQHSEGTKEYPLVADVATLVYLAQVASLELHVPQWRFGADGAPTTPDRIVLDLDPGPGVGLAECAVVARSARTILDGMGLRALPVTSGSKGIHLYARLDGGATSDAVSAVAKELARALEADHPDLVVSSMSKSVRAGRVFVDWSQNNGKKTTIAPYSLRGRTHPTVAAPRTWDELDDPGLRQLLFDEVLVRAAAGPDPLAELDPSDAKPLEAYRRKRSASRTPEPVPESGAAAPAHERGVRFVVQEHHASRLHWDLRLERDGVLASWAVPKGLPQPGERNRLAVRTEDHPLEYATFEGEIPRGEYGAGAMTIWDAGTYDTEKWRDDEIIVTLHGEPSGPLGDARLALIRTSGDGEKSQWLLHRMALQNAAPTPPDPVVDRAPALRPASEPPAPAPGLAAAAPMLAESATPARALAAARRWEPTRAWAEVKWDGVRARAEWDGERLTLRARSGTDITARYPELTTTPGFAEPCIVDGEIVALDATGRPRFGLLQQRMHLTKPREIVAEAARVPVRFHLFDALAADGADLRDHPLAERRAVLDRLIAPGQKQGAIDAPPVFDDVEAALAWAETYDLEGIVVKDPRSRYRDGRSDSWLKVKLVRTQEVVIGGIRPGQRRRAAIGSLLVGIPGPDGLRYAGRVGSGFTERDIARLVEQLGPLRTDASPFIEVPAPDASDAQWVRGELVAEVTYGEITSGGILRHAVWRGLRPDKSPTDVVSET